MTDVTRADATSVSGAAQLQDRGYLERAYKRYSAAIFERLRYQRFDTATAEDLTHIVFEKLARHKKPEDIQDTEGYLFGIARNVAADHHRARAKRHAITEKVEEDIAINGFHSISPEDRTIHREQLNRLLIIIKNLPPRRREALLLSRFKGYDKAEIAAELGISEETVRDHIYKALLACKHEMGLTPVPSVNGTDNSAAKKTRKNGRNG